MQTRTNLIGKIQEWIGDECTEEIAEAVYDELWGDGRIEFVDERVGVDVIDEDVDFLAVAVKVIRESNGTL